MPEEANVTLSRIQNIVAGSISLMDTMAFYINEVTLHRENPKFFILTVTTIISFISPKILYETTSFGLKKWKMKQKIERKDQLS